MRLNFYLIAVIAPAFSWAQTISVQEVVSGLEKAVLQKDTTMLNTVVAPCFGISTYTWPASGRLFLQIANNPDHPIESIQLVEQEIPVTSEGKNRIPVTSEGKKNIPVTSEGKKRIPVLIQEKGREPLHTHLFVNEQNEILYVDYFDQLFGKFRYGKSERVASVPFTLHEGGSIVLTIRLNNHPKELLFLFDSGADGMAISQALATELGLTGVENKEASVVGGKMQVQVSSGNTVHIDTLKLENQNIALFEKMGRGVDGLIGLNIAKLFITRFDFDAMQMSLHRFGEYAYGEGESVPITVPKGVMIIPGSLDLIGKGAVDGNFAFDTGAHYYLLGFSPFVRKNKMLVGGFKSESQSTTVSLGKATPTFNGRCADFRIHRTHLKEMPVSLQAGANWNAGADGSLGIKYISRYNFTINLLDKVIHLQPNKRFDLPLIP